MFVCRLIEHQCHCFRSSTLAPLFDDVRPCEWIEMDSQFIPSQMKWFFDVVFGEKAVNVHSDVNRQYERSNSIVASTSPDSPLNLSIPSFVDFHHSIWSLQH